MPKARTTAPFPLKGPGNLLPNKALIWWKSHPTTILRSARSWILENTKFQAQKKAAEARKKQKTQSVKEIKMRPNIDTHDYDVKMRSVNKFLGEGDKVKVTLRFRGREMAHMELGMELLNRVKEDLAEISKVEAEPKLEGRQMMMVVAPAK